MRGQPLVAVIFAAIVFAGCVGDAAAPRLGWLTGLAAGHLSSALGPTLILEVDHADGKAPARETLDFVIGVLRNVTTKEEIRLVGPTLEAAIPTELDGREWSREDLSSVARAVRDEQDTREARVLHVLYVGGRYPNASGLYSASDGIFIFDEGIASQTPYQLVIAREFERHVLLHEAGHALGLVDHGAPMLHDRLVEGAHSAYRESVMYVHERVQLEEEPLWLLTPRSLSFDRYDLEDLAALDALAWEHVRARGG